MTELEFLGEARTFYDAIAVQYADRFRDYLASKPLDRMLLSAFAEVARGPILDVGCGPGEVTAFLASHGVDIRGIDLSPEMVALARNKHPSLQFDAGSMTALEVPDSSLGGVVAWYSTIHIPDDQLLGVFAEFARVLGPGGHLLLAFQVGDLPRRLTEPFGHPVALDFRRRRPDTVAALLANAGFQPQWRLTREPTPDESTPQAYLLVQKPARRP